MTRQTLPLLAAAVLATATATAAQAQDWIVKAGVLRYDTHSKTSGIAGIGVPPGADAIVGDATTAVFTIERKFTPNIGVELAVGIPPRVKARGAGSVAFLGDDILSAKNWGPAMFVNYHFGDANARLRPFIGLGFDYTWFRSVKSKLAPQVTMTDSFGLAAHAGIDYSVSKSWGLFASIARVDVRSEVTAIGVNVLTSSIDFRPWTYSAGVYFSF
jgi:outer membrane protein